MGETGARDHRTHALAMAVYAAQGAMVEGNTVVANKARTAKALDKILRRYGFVVVDASALPDAATVAAVRVAIAACDEQAARRALLANELGIEPDGADAAEQAASEAQMARDAAATLRTFLAAQEGTDDGNG